MRNPDTKLTTVNFTTKTIQLVSNCSDQNKQQQSPVKVPVEVTTTNPGGHVKVPQGATSLKSQKGEEFVSSPPA
ncbi:CLUMA_CG003116, isoform A [Clunio marinus]|uniref:CLUMA_CG003116, isoform A n=1 Tax=Clunio marinus TaxID=568069 RepID=A0A1J1HMR9_9DIPT|nr:CLUMA_CG003116, isoform A [Clunio marinus]